MRVVLVCGIGRSRKNKVKENVLETIGGTPLLKLNPERLGYKEVSDDTCKVGVFQSWWKCQGSDCSIDDR